MGEIIRLDIIGTFLSLVILHVPSLSSTHTNASLQSGTRILKLNVNRGSETGSRVSMKMLIARPALGCWWYWARAGPSEKARLGFGL